MIQITIKRSGIVTNGPAKFETLELADEWLTGCLTKNKFGLPERLEVDESGEPTGIILPAEFEVIQEIVEPSYVELRLKEYIKIDTMKMEAIIEHFEGRPEKMAAYLNLRAAIKLSYPKPV